MHDPGIRRWGCLRWATSWRSRWALSHPSHHREIRRAHAGGSVQGEYTALRDTPCARRGQRTGRVYSTARYAVRTQGAAYREGGWGVFSMGRLTGRGVRVFTLVSVRWEGARVCNHPCKVHDVYIYSVSHRELLVCLCSSVRRVGTARRHQGCCTR
jgi:hypothetical protein